MTAVFVMPPTRERAANIRDAARLIATEWEAERITADEHDLLLGLVDAELDAVVYEIRGGEQL